jgi:hypothetical protein
MDKRNEKTSAKRNDIPEGWNPGDITIDHVMREWEVVIKTQMHFNDLIIKYRTTIVSVFITLVGVLITLTKIPNVLLTQQDFKELEWLLGAFLVCACLIDICYYHQMLLGAVRYAEKFDSQAKCKQLGLFGMTQSIRGSVSVSTSRWMIGAFYLGPLLVLAIIRFTVR